MCNGILAQVNFDEDDYDVLKASIETLKNLRDSNKHALNTPVIGICLCGPGRMTSHLKEYAASYGKLGLKIYPFKDERRLFHQKECLYDHCKTTLADCIKQGNINCCSVCEMFVCKECKTKHMPEEKSSSGRSRRSSKKRRKN